MRKLPSVITLQTYDRFWRDVTDEDTDALISTTDFIQAAIIQDRYARENPGTPFRLISDVGIVGIVVCYPPVAELEPLPY